VSEGNDFKTQGRCELARPIRDASGTLRFGECPEVLREVDNLGRQMLLVRFDDGGTIFLFPHEVKRWNEGRRV
jgi:hypothetical protein